MRKDLQKFHPFAHERVSFITCRFALASKGDLLVLAHEYYPVADDDYINDQRFGALINTTAFRKAMQIAYSENVGVFHVHLHSHQGKPMPSGIDVRETMNFVPDFFHVRPNLPHGAIILSLDSVSGRIWYPSGEGPLLINRFTIVGAPLSEVEE